MKANSLGLLTIMAALAVNSAAAMQADPTLHEVITGDHREADARARDVYRNPHATLAFFGLQPNMSVIEIWPGQGWYTDILAPYLRDSGQYIAADFGLEPSGPYADFMRRMNSDFAEMVNGNPSVYGDVLIAHLAPPAEVDLAQPGSIDMVLTFRNFHNWQMWGGTGAALDGIFRALKPGGVLGIVDHRADPEAPIDVNAKNGYVNEQRTVELVEAAGFRLTGRSEVNANPADSKDYEFGVWTLPPTLRKGDEDRDRYIQIGESDRFTLRFVKPE